MDSRESRSGSGAAHVEKATSEYRLNLELQEEHRSEISQTSKRGLNGDTMRKDRCLSRRILCRILHAAQGTREHDLLDYRE